VATRVSLAFNPTTVSYLPFEYAVDRGYFDEVGLDLQITRLPATQGSTAILPDLARGDLDLAPQALVPDFYAPGLNIRGIAGITAPKPGRTGLGWFNVLAEQASAFTDLSDLRGRTIEAGSEGSLGNLFAHLAIARAGLTVGENVTIQHAVASWRINTADQIALATSQGADVLIMLDPLATQCEKQNLGIVRWKAFSEIAPDTQTTLLASSSQFLARKGGATVRTFLEVYLRTCREINAANGKWTPSLLATTTSWSGLDAKTIADPGGVPYYDPDGALTTQSLDEIQAVWLASGVVKRKIDVRTLLDLEPLTDAVHALEIRSK
jgi:ABC-type nitrate/sulfonate/bicarbonate transport system substrate-binding protein